MAAQTEDELRVEIEEIVLDVRSRLDAANRRSISPGITKSMRYRELKERADMSNLLKSAEAALAEVIK